MLDDNHSICMSTTSEPMISMSEIEDARQSLEIKLQRIRESLESR